jgi:hypothetical protein
MSRPNHIQHIAKEIEKIESKVNLGESRLTCFDRYAILQFTILPNWSKLSNGPNLSEGQKNMFVLFWAFLL